MSAELIQKSFLVNLFKKRPIRVFKDKIGFYVFKSKNVKYYLKLPPNIKTLKEAQKYIGKLIKINVSQAKNQNKKAKTKNITVKYKPNNIRALSRDYASTSEKLSKAKAEYEAITNQLKEENKKQALLTDELLKMHIMKEQSIKQIADDEKLARDLPESPKSSKSNKSLNRELEKTKSELSLANVSIVNLESEKKKLESILDIQTKHAAELDRDLQLATQINTQINNPLPTASRIRSKSKEKSSYKRSYVSKKQMSEEEIKKISDFIQKSNPLPPLEEKPVIVPEPLSTIQQNPVLSSTQPINQPISQKLETIEEEPPETQQGSGNEKLTPLYSDEIENYFTDKFNESPNIYWPFSGVIARDQILELPNEPEQGFIMNLDKSNQPGSHWVAVYLNKDSLEYFDPLANPIPEQVKADLKDLITRLKVPYLLKFKINQIRRQDPRTGTCGYHAISFLDDRFNGYDFPLSTRYKLGVNDYGKPVIDESEVGEDKIKSEFKFI